MQQAALCARAHAPDQHVLQLTGSAAVQGMQVGVMRQVIDPDSADPQFSALFARALSDLARAGAAQACGCAACLPPPSALSAIACLQEQEPVLPGWVGPPMLASHSGCEPLSAWGVLAVTAHSSLPLHVAKPARACDLPGPRGLYHHLGQPAARGPPAVRAWGPASPPMRAQGAGCIRLAAACAQGPPSWTTSRSRATRWARWAGTAGWQSGTQGTA